MPNIWFKPLQTRQDVSDRLENLASISALVSDLLAQGSIDHQFQLSKDGEFGLANLFFLLEESIRESLSIILNREEVKL